MHACARTLDYRFNTLAEEYGSGSRCINHGTSQRWSVNGKTISDTGGGCYKVCVVNFRQPYSLVHEKEPAYMRRQPTVHIQIAIQSCMLLN